MISNEKIQKLAKETVSDFYSIRPSLKTKGYLETLIAILLLEVARHMWLMVIRACIISLIISTLLILFFS